MPRCSAVARPPRARPRRSGVTARLRPRPTDRTAAARPACCADRRRSATDTRSDRLPHEPERRPRGGWTPTILLGCCGGMWPWPRPRPRQDRRRGHVPPTRLKEAHRTSAEASDRALPWAVRADGGPRAARADRAASPCSKWACPGASTQRSRRGPYCQAAGGRPRRDPPRWPLPTRALSPPRPRRARPNVTELP